ncbi:hypothetical protein Tco_1426502, partial [Tanacetum coccineum]
DVILFYNGLKVPTQQILDSKGVIPSKTAADAKVAIQEMDEYSQKWHNGASRIRSTETSDGLAAIQAPYYTKDFPLKEEGKNLKEAYYTQFGAPFQGGDIEQQLQDSTKGTMQILRIKNDDNL